MMKTRLNYFAQSPELAKKLQELSMALNQSSIEKPLMHLIFLRASQINECAFCVDMHVKEAKIDGERELRLHHIPVWRESPLFSDRERAALEWTEAVTLVHKSHVPDEVYMRVRNTLSEKEISDLTFAVGLINMWNRLAISFRSVPGSQDRAFGLEKAGLH